MENLERSQSTGTETITEKETYEETRILLLEKEKSEWQFTNGLSDIRNYYIEVNGQMSFMCKHNERNKNFSFNKRIVAQTKGKNSNQILAYLIKGIDHSVHCLWKFFIRQYEFLFVLCIRCHTTWKNRGELNELCFRLCESVIYL